MCTMRSSEKERKVNITTERFAGRSTKSYEDNNNNLKTLLLPSVTASYEQVIAFHGCTDGPTRFSERVQGPAKFTNNDHLRLACSQ